MEHWQRTFDPSLEILCHRNKNITWRVVQNKGTINHCALHSQERERRKRVTKNHLKLRPQMPDRSNTREPVIERTQCIYSMRAETLLSFVLLFCIFSRSSHSKATSESSEGREGKKTFYPVQLAEQWANTAHSLVGSARVMLHEDELKLCSQVQVWASHRFGSLGNRISRE